jgi:hypothetical protein
MNALEELRLQARKRAIQETRGAPAHVASAWVPYCIARVTDEHAERALAWAARFVVEYEDLLHRHEEPMSEAHAARARERLAFWQLVGAEGSSVGGSYDAVGTRDRLRAYLRGEFDDEIDACRCIYVEAS